MAVLLTTLVDRADNPLVDRLEDVTGALASAFELPLIAARKAIGKLSQEKNGFPMTLDVQEWLEQAPTALAVCQDEEALDTLLDTVDYALRADDYLSSAAFSSLSVLKSGQLPVGRIAQPLTDEAIDLQFAAQSVRDGARSSGLRLYELPWQGNKRQLWPLAGMVSQSEIDLKEAIRLSINAQDKPFQFLAAPVYARALIDIFDVLTFGTPQRVSICQAPGRLMAFVCSHQEDLQAMGPSFHAMLHALMIVLIAQGHDAPASCLKTAVDNAMAAQDWQPERPDFDPSQWLTSVTVAIKEQLLLVGQLMHGRMGARDENA